MQNNSIPFVVDVIVWTCVLAFVATAVVTLLALLGVIRLGGGDGKLHDYYLRVLFHVFLIEISAASVTAFAAYLNHANEQTKALAAQIQRGNP